MSQQDIQDFLKENPDRKFTADELEIILKLSTSSVYSSLHKIRLTLQCRNVDCRGPLTGVERDCPYCRKKIVFSAGIKCVKDMRINSFVYWWA